MLLRPSGWCRARQIQIASERTADTLAKLQKASFAAGLGLSSVSTVLAQCGRLLLRARGHTIPDWEDETKTWEERFVAFYSTHAPEVVNRVPALLRKYAGREHVPYLAISSTMLSPTRTRQHPWHCAACPLVSRQKAHLESGDGSWQVGRGDERYRKLSRSPKARKAPVLLARSRNATIGAQEVTVTGKTCGVVLTGAAPPLVKELVADGEAARAGVAIGSALLSVNGADVSTLLNTTCAEVLAHATRPLRLCFRAKPEWSRLAGIDVGDISEVRPGVPAASAEAQSPERRTSDRNRALARAIAQGARTLTIVGSERSMCCELPVRAQQMSLQRPHAPACLPKYPPSANVHTHTHTICACASRACDNTHLYQQPNTPTLFCPRRPMFGILSFAAPGCNELRGDRAGIAAIASRLAQGAAERHARPCCGIGTQAKAIHRSWEWDCENGAL